MKLLLVSWGQLTATFPLLRHFQTLSLCCVKDMYLFSLGVFQRVVYLLEWQSHQLDILIFRNCQIKLVIAKYLIQM